MRPQVRGLRAALNANKRFKARKPELTIDHLVVGGGVVGLAMAQRLGLMFPNKSTYLVERHNTFGGETSSRNSEVIHAGLYYPPTSLKTSLCLRGRDLMYERCRTHNIPFKKVGKLVVARPEQHPYLESLHAKAELLSLSAMRSISKGKDYTHIVPTAIISGAEARKLEPDLSPEIHAALWSPETGIVDSHAFMESLEKDILDAKNSELVYSTRVVRIDRKPDGMDPGWIVQLVTGDSEEGDALLARTVINCAGLTAPLILNAILPEEQRLPMYFARGSYASYSGPGVKNVSHLIYPSPVVGSNKYGFQSLGTHLTLDLQGKIRFGPDLDWLDPPEGSEDTDFWQQHLVPDESRLALMSQAVREYLPGISEDRLQPDYCGVRPKLVGPDGGFQDFVFRRDTANEDEEGDMISLLGIESPGLTSSLAIAEYVVDHMLGGGRERE